MTWAHNPFLEGLPWTSGNLWHWNKHSKPMPYTIFMLYSIKEFCVYELYVNRSININLSGCEISEIQNSQ